MLHKIWTGFILSAAEGLGMTDQKPRHIIPTLRCTQDKLREAQSKAVNAAAPTANGSVWGETTCIR